MIAGLIAYAWGPAIGGLFLAFPAIFPAAATLLDEDERENRPKAGIRGTTREDSKWPSRPEERH